MKDHYFLSNRLKKLRAKVGDCEKELDEIEKYMGLLGYDQGCFARFRRHMDKIMENAPDNAQKAMPKKQNQQIFRIPRINVKDIFGEVIISEFTGKRKATGPCELPKSKKISTESQNSHNTEVLEADENNIVSGTEEQGCTEQIEKPTEEARVKPREQRQEQAGTNRQEEEIEVQNEQECTEQIENCTGEKGREETEEATEKDIQEEKMEEQSKQECTEQIENVTRGKGREEIEEHVDNDRQEEEMKEQDEQEYTEQMEKPTKGKDREEMEEEVVKDRQEQVYKDGQRLESEEVVGEKIDKNEQSNKQPGREQTRKILEQNKMIRKEIVEKKKGQSRTLHIQVFAEVDCVNSNRHETQVGNCGNNLTPRYDRRATGAVPQEQQNPKRYYCHQCPKSFSEEKTRTRHIRQRCGKVEKDLKCDQCPKEFYDRESLLDHIDRHNNTPQHKCPHCNAVFFARKSKKAHMDTAHAK